jgi:hypothetical protein
MLTLHLLEENNFTILKFWCHLKLYLHSSWEYISVVHPLPSGQLGGLGNTIK